MFSFVNVLFEKCKHCLMLAYAWNEATYVSDIFVIMIFFDASKKRINPSAKEYENIWVKMFSNFLTTRILKELVITVGNKSISINTPFHFGTFWIKSLGASRGTILKNRINILITLAQAIGHKTHNLETYFSNSSKIRQQKMMSFWKKLIIGNLVCIKTCYSFKPIKTHRWPKT